MGVVPRDVWSLYLGTHGGRGCVASGCDSGLSKLEITCITAQHLAEAAWTPQLVIVMRHNDRLASIRKEGLSLACN